MHNPKIGPRKWILELDSKFLIMDAENTLTMTLDEKIRYGMLALAGASVVFASLGLNIGPLEIIRGWGSS